jgi:hypothetical protein
MSADSDQEIPSDEKVNLIGVKGLILVGGGVEEDKSVVEEMLDLRDLFVVEAVLYRKGMYPNEVDKYVQIFLFGLIVIKPYESAFAQRCHSPCERFNSVKQSPVGEMIESGFGHIGFQLNGYVSAAVEPVKKQITNYTKSFEGDEAA